MGQFIVALFDGEQSTWLDVLKKTQVSPLVRRARPEPRRGRRAGQRLRPQRDADLGHRGLGRNALTVDLTLGGLRLDGQRDGGAQGRPPPAPAGSSSSRAAPWSAATPARRSRRAGTPPRSPTGRSRSRPGPTPRTGRPPRRAAAPRCRTAAAAPTCSSTTWRAATANWTAGGLWHLAQGVELRQPRHTSSGAGAWYFGQDSGCSYKASGAVKGTLTSRSISGVTASSKLSFQYWREVESASSGSYDKTVVEVSARRQQLEDAVEQGLQGRLGQELDELGRAEPGRVRRQEHPDPLLLRLGGQLRQRPRRLDHRRRARDALDPDLPSVLPYRPFETTILSPAVRRSCAITDRKRDRWQS